MARSSAAMVARSTKRKLPVASRRRASCFSVERTPSTARAESRVAARQVGRGRQRALGDRDLVRELSEHVVVASDLAKLDVRHEVRLRSRRSYFRRPIPGLVLA
jgi:hypothetical protein